MATVDELWQMITERREGVLGTVGRDGRPQLSNILYVTDPVERVVRISTTSDRVKARNIARNPRAALHVLGVDFWQYAVADAAATLSTVAREPEDDATSDLLEVHSAFYGAPENVRAFYDEMIANRRLVIRLHVEHLYGLTAPGGRRPRQA